MYIALFTTLPGADGTGGIETSYTSYARVAVTDWQTLTVGTTTVRRQNVGAIEMVAVGLGDPGVTIVGWGIYDASSAGNLRHFGPLRNAAGTEQPQALVVGGQLRWADGTFKVQFSPTTDQTEAAEMSALYGPTLTTNATPATNDLYTLEDEEAVVVEVELFCRHTDAAATDYHYYRKVRAAYSRDGTTSLWYLHEITPDGAATRDILTTATAELVLSGNTVRAQFTGEAAKNLTWFALVRSVSDKA
jgi:hypothetical protein